MCTSGKGAEGQADHKKYGTEDIKKNKARAFGNLASRYALVSELCRCQQTIINSLQRTSQLYQH